MEIAGQVALVTGGAVRIGRALAEALAVRRARVAVHYGRSAEAAADLVAKIIAGGGEAMAIQGDLRDTARLGTIIDGVASRFGRVDILVNNAAVFQPGDVADTTEALWDTHFAINLKAPFFLSQAFATQLGEDPGQIVNLVDWRATRPDGHYLAYTLTKAGLLTLTRSLAVALAPRIRVNAIAPGAILAPPGEDEAYLERLAAHIPLRRPGSPAAVVRALCYLLEADFVTGEVIFVTGGEHL